VKGTQRRKRLSRRRLSHPKVIRQFRTIDGPFAAEKGRSSECGGPDRLRPDQHVRLLVLAGETIILPGAGALIVAGGRRGGVYDGGQIICLESMHRGQPRERCAGPASTLEARNTAQHWMTCSASCPGRDRWKTDGTLHRSRPTREAVARTIFRGKGQPRQSEPPRQKARAMCRARAF